MIELGPHAIYIVWAYIGVFLVTLGMIARVVMSSRAARHRLAALDAARPETPSSGSPV